MTYEEISADFKYQEFRKRLQATGPWQFTEYYGRKTLELISDSAQCPYTATHGGKGYNENAWRTDVYKAADEREGYIPELRRDLLEDCKLA